MATRFGRALGAAISFAAALLVGGFLATEIAPNILFVIPHPIRYVFLRTIYEPDPELVFVYRTRNGIRDDSPFLGDLFKPEYGVEVEPIDYVAGYTADGFRRNSSGPPYDLVVIGDSFIEIGERDDATFAELLKAETGMSVLNLGMAFYGPHQYLEVLKRHGLKAKPKYAVLSLFAGNDFQDIVQYQNWKNGGSYYFYDLSTSDTILSRLAYGVLGSLLASAADAQVVQVQVGGRLVPMAFGYLERPVTREQSQALRSILEEFASTCRGAAITPVVMYVPSAIQMHPQLMAAASETGEGVVNPSLEVVTVLTQELGIDLINLLPVFIEQTSQGRLMYYPFDTHWNIEGRRTAASLVASSLRLARQRSEYVGLR